MRHTDRSSGFTILEVMIVLVIIGIVGAIALPTVTAISKRRAEVTSSGDTASLLHAARDTAYKKLHCVEVREVTNPADGLVANEVPCVPADAGPVPVDSVSYDPAIVDKVDITGTGRLVFHPSGGLTPGSPARVVHVTMQSGRNAWFEIQPALGTIRECKTYDPGKDPACQF
jgi:prepilin-type N-terminal cleavage/methylation domain-containing protein